MSFLLVGGKFQAFDDDGDPLSGGLLYTYEPGTSTPKTTYDDKVLGTPNANPVVLDDRGEASVYLSEATKLVLKTSAGVTIWTQDDVLSVDQDETYTKTELDGGQLDTLYYTETELDAGQLDNRYLIDVEVPHTADRTGASDAAAAIQAAIDAAEVRGAGIVYLPPGTYLVNSTLTVSKTGIQIVGAGSGSQESSNADHVTVLKWGGGAAPLLDFGDGGTTTVFACKVRDLSLDGQDVANSIGIRLNDSCSNFVFSNVTIFDFHTCIYGGESCFANRYENVVCYGFLNCGWRLYDKNHNTVWYGCKAWGCSAKTPTSSVRVGETEACNQLSFYGCDFEAWNVTQQVEIWDADGVGFFGCYMEAKDADTAYQISLGTAAGSVVSGFVISGVRMIGNSAGANAIRFANVEEGIVAGNFATGFTTNFILATAGNVDNVLIGPNKIGAAMTLSNNYGGISVQAGTGGVSWWGESPLVTKPAVSGSRGGNAALASLLTQLENYGLITDNSS